jgi:hypothetical protein
MCGGDHWARDCDIRDEVKALGKKLRKERDRQRKTKRDEKSKRSSSDKKPKSKRRSKSKKENGYAANYVDNSSPSNNSDSNETSSSSDSDDHKPKVEKVHLSRVKLSKATPADWIFDTGATSHMADNIHLFRQPLRQVPEVIIQCGGGELSSDQRGTATVVCEDGSWCEMEDVLFVPNLGVNLISAKRLCKKGLEGSFDKTHMYVSKGGNIAVLAEQKDGLYIVSHVSSKYRGKAFIAHKKRAFPVIDIYDHEMQEESDVDPDDSEVEEATTKSDRRLYRKMHRRFAHYGPNMISKLHKVTTLRNQIKVPPRDKRICKSCQIGKMRNRTSKTLAVHKREALELVSLDIAGPFPTSLRGNRYFMQIIDNFTRKNWSIPLKTKGEAMTSLRSWKVKEELQTGKKVKAARSDNAPELKNVLDTWEKEDGIRADYTTTATSSQNGPAERSIQTAENAMRAMLDDAEMPMEFWDEAVEADAYIRNRLPTGPTIKSKSTCPEQAYTGQKPNILNVRVWGSKAYDYVNPKTLPAKARHDKLMPRGRVGVFMGPSDSTEKQFKIYAPDLGYTRLTSVILVDEAVKGGTVDLKLRDNPNGPQGTPNDLPTRKARGRPQAAKPTPQVDHSQLDDPVSHTIPDEPIEPAPITPEPKKQASPSKVPVVEIPFVNPGPNIPAFTEDEDGNVIPIPNVDQPTQIQANDDVVDQEMDDISNEPIEAAIEPPSPPKRFFSRKRKRDEDDMTNERWTKITKAMIAAFVQTEQTEAEQALSAIEIPTASALRKEVTKRVYKTFFTALRA